MKDDKRLKRKVRNSYIVSTVSITLVLFLLGSVGYLMVAALKVADTLQESIAVTVELKNGLSEAQKETISKRLTAEEMVATIAYSAKEEKAEEEEFRKMFGSSFEEILPENPLLDSFELTLTSASSDKELLDSFIAAAGRIEGVDRVSYPALMAERLHATVNKIRLVLLLFGGALLVISLILLSNTIRLAIFSKRYLINTMKLVGATKWFIMRPFLGSSLTQGILAGTAASALFGLAVYGLNEAVPELMTIAAAARPSGPGLDTHCRSRQNRHHPRLDDCGRHHHLGAFHLCGPQQIHQHEVEQDIPLLNEKRTEERAGPRTGKSPHAPYAAQLRPAGDRFRGRPPGLRPVGRRRQRLARRIQLRDVLVEAHHAGPDPRDRRFRHRDLCDHATLQVIPGPLRNAVPAGRPARQRPADRNSRQLKPLSKK